MAKARHDQPPESNRNTLIIMAVGGVLVAALVVWALTRTVEPAPATFPTAATPVAEGTTAPPLPLPTPDTGFPAINTATTGVNPNPLTPNPAAQTPVPSPQGDRAEVRRIAVEDLKAQVDRGDVTVIDVRDAASFATGHIPGAVNMPFASIEAQVDAIPKGKPIVTYCT
jgi:Rhodanese-like domain